MDPLLNLTLKVFENRNIAKENLIHSKGDLAQYEECARKLKKNFSEVTTTRNKREGIVQINNVMKKEFTENVSQTKALFGAIYKYVQEIDKNLSKLHDGDASLHGLYDENKQRLVKIKNDIDNNVKLLQIKKKHVDEKSLGNCDAIFKEKVKVEAEIKKYEEDWQNLIEEYEEKQQSSQALKLDIEVLEDELQVVNQQFESLANERKEFNDQILLKINQEAEVQQKILEVEKQINELNEKTKEITEEKEKNLLQLSQKTNILEKLYQQCADSERFIEEQKKEIPQILQELESETEENERNILEIKAWTELIKQIEEKVKVKKWEIEKGEGEIETNNRNLQQTIEQQQLKLKELKLQQTKYQEDLLQKEKETKKLTAECDNAAKEINRLESEQLIAPKKMLPTPTIKNKPSNPPPPPPRKRALPTFDVESDSSVDGEKLSYAEFMMAKRKNYKKIKK